MKRRRLSTPNYADIIGASLIGLTTVAMLVEFIYFGFIKWNIKS